MEIRTLWGRGWKSCIWLVVIKESSFLMQSSQRCEEGKGYVHWLGWSRTIPPCNGLCRSWCLAGETWKCCPKDCWLGALPCLRGRASAKGQCRSQVTFNNNCWERSWWEVQGSCRLWGCADLITWWREGVRKAWVGHTRNAVFTQP